MNLAEDMNGTKPNAGTWYGTKVGYSTVFPASIARGAAFDLDLEYAIGEAIGDEMMAAKQTLLLAPCMNLVRHPSWGRTQENYSEDSYLTGRMASAMIIGVQQHITANAKHYMVYDIEKGRDFNDMSADEQTLREIYGRHFRMVVQDGGVGSVMASYNMVNGTKSVENTHTLTDVLRDDFGFNGFVLSDWWAMNPQVKVDTDSDDPQGIRPQRRAGRPGRRAALDAQLRVPREPRQDRRWHHRGRHRPVGGAASCCRRSASTAYDLDQGTWGLGQPKTTYKKGRIVYSGCDGHIDLSRKAAVKSMVLLKNAGNTLPISPAVTKVAVVGATVAYKTKNDGRVTDSFMNFAKDVHTGDMGSSRVFADPATERRPLRRHQEDGAGGVTVETTAAPIDSVDRAQSIGTDPRSAPPISSSSSPASPPATRARNTPWPRIAPPASGWTSNRRIRVRGHPEQAHRGRDRHGQAHGGRPRGRQRHRHAVAATGSGRGHGLVRGHGGRRGHGPAPVGHRQNFSGKLPFTWGRFDRLPRVQGGDRRDHEPTTTWATATSTRTASRRSSRSATA